MNLFLVQSGNLGDTCNILPVLSGIYNKYGEKISLVVREKMKNFKGFKKLIESQPFIDSLKFEGEDITGEYIPVFLENEYDTKFNIPYETIRYYEYFRRKMGLSFFDVDESFNLIVPEKKVNVDSNLYIIGDRKYSKHADTRRAFDVLKSSNHFPESKCYFLEYNNDLIHNLNIIRNSKNPFITTFTGIAVLADLMYKETMVCYSTDIQNWDGFPINKSFKQHFFQNRNCELVSLEDFGENNKI